MSLDSPLRIAVIGAGFCGLAAIKSCLDEKLVPVCFERTNDFGGLWRYTEDTEFGQGCVMKSTVINTSKEMMSFSDFPVPEHFPIFMHNRQVLEYLELYAKNFGLEKYIQYGTEVLSVKKADEFCKYGQWKIETRTKKTGETKVDIFDGVMVCTGHHACQYEPEFPGMDTFKGKVLHSHDYRHAKGYEGQRVLVIGIGNSGGDVANETSRVASQVFLSTRQGTWILNRVADSGLPLDMLYTRRAMEFLRITEFFWIINKIMKRRLNQRIDHDLYCLRPSYEPLQQHPMINDDLPNRIICGSVMIKTNVERFTENGVHFIDGTFEDNIDTVVLATGYSFGFPFIDKEVIDVKDNIVNMYLNTFLPDLERQTMAIIGCVQGFGAITPAAEMQSRTACRVFKRAAFLPSSQQMWKEIRRTQARNAERFAKSRRHTIQIDIMPFMDALAKICGCSVNIWNLMRTDPLLAFHVFFGPLTPYQLRLFGPGKWSGAREAILNQWKRIYAPLKTRRLPDKGGNGINWFFLFSILLVIYLVFTFIFQ